MSSAKEWAAFTMRRALAACSFFVLFPGASKESEEAPPLSRELGRKNEGPKMVKGKAGKTARTAAGLRRRRRRSSSSSSRRRRRRSTAQASPTPRRALGSHPPCAVASDLPCRLVEGDRGLGEGGWWCGVCVRGGIWLTD